MRNGENTERPLRILYSFPHRLGMSRICTTAWHEIDSTVQAGAEMLVMAGDSVRPFSRPVRVETTLSRGRLRIPYRLLGPYRACALHDWLVARRLPSLVGKIDIIHTWPLAALRTIRAAKKLGIPVALERCNAHTRFAYEVVQRECQRIGVPLPPGHEHAYNKTKLEHEEKEYAEADALLCPSDFVVKTFLDQGFLPEKLFRHQYGFDERVFFPGNQNAESGCGLTMLFVGGCAPRKGLHYALEAWLKSKASRDGKFLIAGEFIPAYREKLAPMLSHPSVKILGHRTDVPELMRQSDILILPTIEEGSALVTSEARGSGCVLLVSEAAGAICRHGTNALIHSVGDVETLADHITTLHQDRGLLSRLRNASITTVHEITWTAAGRSLLKVYRLKVAGFQASSAEV
jgi:glycosyltransferase involved in cell wall biosynthesis